MKINVWKYVQYLWVGYIWGRCFSSLYALIDNSEEWRLFAFYAFLSIVFTAFDIIEIKATEKRWFDSEEEKTSILGARVYGTKTESEE